MLSGFLTISVTPTLTLFGALMSLLMLSDLHLAKAVLVWDTDIGSHSQICPKGMRSLICASQASYLNGCIAIFIQNLDFCPTHSHLGLLHTDIWACILPVKSKQPFGPVSLSRKLSPRHDEPFRSMSNGFPLVARIETRRPDNLYAFG